MVEKAAKKKTPRKKKTGINLDAIDFKTVLEEGVLVSRLGRALASYGATLTNREKTDAKLVYSLLKARKKLPEDSVATAYITSDKKAKKYSPTEVIDWFVKNFPKEAEPLLAKREEEYNQTERGIAYGLEQGYDFPDERYIETLEGHLEIPNREAKWLYLRVIKPHLEREYEEEGLVKASMEKTSSKK